MFADWVGVVAVGGLWVEGGEPPLDGELWLYECGSRWALLLWEDWLLGTDEPGAWRERICGLVEKVYLDYTNFKCKKLTIEMSKIGTKQLYLKMRFWYLYSRIHPKQNMAMYFFQ